MKESQKRAKLRKEYNLSDSIMPLKTGLDCMDCNSPIIIDEAQIMLSKYPLKLYCHCGVTK